MKSNFSNIGQRIKELRERLQLSQEEFAEPARLQIHQISKFERAEVTPTTDALNKLYETYGVDLTWLMSGQGSMFVGSPGEVLRPGGEITSADMLHSIAGHLVSAYNKYQQSQTATAPWILNLTKSLRILLEDRKSVDRKRKLWRRKNAEDTLLRDIEGYFPGDRSGDIHARIAAAIDILSLKERVDAVYALGVANSLRLAAHEFGFLEFTGKHRLSNETLQDLTDLLVPWCDWVATAAIGRCSPLHVNPSQLIGKPIDTSEELPEFDIQESRDLVTVDAKMSKAHVPFWCAFKFINREHIYECSEVELYSLVRAIEKLSENPKRGLSEIGAWDLFKDDDLSAYYVRKDGGRQLLGKAEFEQFLELAGILWDHPDVRSAVVRSVLAECGAL